MMIEVGARYVVDTLVTEEKTAKAVGSGDMEVFATPMLAALVEQAAALCLAQALEEGKTSVGVQLNLSHLAATPVGMRVTATAEVVGIEGRKVLFRVSAQDEKELIGEGEHVRVVVDRERFYEKAQAKRGN